MKKTLFVAMLCLGIFSSTVFASPINLPTGIKGQEGSGLRKDLPVGISAGFLYDHVDSRELSDDSGEVNFDMVGGKIILSGMNTFDIYTMLGSTQNTEFKASVSGSNYIFSLGDNFMWGVGASAIIHEWKDGGIQLFGDANYRETKDIGVDSVTVNGSPATLTGTVNVDWQEWQVAFGVSKKFEYVIPYAGVVYSDVNASAKATINGTTYDPDSVSSENTFGPFVGISILPTKWLSIDVSGRFVAEQAVSVGATVKF